MEKITVEQLEKRVCELEKKNKELEQLVLSIFRSFETYVTFSEVAQ